MLRRRISFFVLSTTLLAGVSSYARAQSTGENAKPPPVAVLSSAQAPDTSPLAKAAQLYRIGKFDSAAQEYETVLLTDPNAELAHVGLVRIYLKQKRIAEAYSAAAKAVELAPKSNAVHVALGEVYFRQGRFPEAETEFLALTKAGTTEARAYLGLSLIYKAASYHKRAKQAVDRAHALDPADPDIQKAWMGTLSLKEQLKALQVYIAGETNDDAEQRRKLEEQIVVLQDQAGKASRPCRLTNKVTEMETKLELLMDDPKHIRGVGLSVKLNGVSSKLLLDTGAGGILVSSRIAEKARIKRLAQTDLKGIGDKGAASGYIGYAESIKVGDLEFQDCYVRVIDKGSVLGDDGLIGANVFSDFLIDLDYPNYRFRLSQLPSRPGEPGSTAGQSPSSEAVEFHDRYIAPEMKSFTPVFRFGHDLLIQTRVNDAAPKLFLIDTGAFSNTITPSAAREVTKVSSDSTLTIKGVSGNVKDVFRADQLTLQFGHFRQKNVDIVAFDTKSISDSIGAEVSGILGFAMLRMLEIKIDYRNGLVDFVYDPARWR